jgi:hypothetical protein
MKYTITTKPLTVSVKNHEELVAIMRTTSIFFAGQQIKEYMAGFAERAKSLISTPIDPSSIETFVSTCIQAGFLKKHTSK